MTPARNDNLRGKNHSLKRNNNIQEMLKKLIDALINQICIWINQLVGMMRQLFHKKRLPWFKLSIICILVYVLFTRDMNFNFSMNAPAKASGIQTEMNDYKPSQTSFRSVEKTKPKVKLDPKKEAYVLRFASTAITEMEKFGIPASIKMAQGLIESRAGESGLAAKNNNHFGIKCFSKKCGKGHCANFSDDHHKDFFRKYKTAWESWRDHSYFLTKDRYKDLVKYEKDYKAWAHGLKERGYATDPQYAEKLIDIIEKYELYKLDK